jgi:hypothetical protein
MSQTWTTGPVAVAAAALPVRAFRTMSSISAWLSTFSTCWFYLKG